MTSSRLPSPSLASSLSEEQLRRYLLASEWVETGTLKGVATVWHHNDSEDAEVVLPLKGRARDFEARMTDALRALRGFENRTIEEIAADILNLSVDVIGVRVSHADVSAGTIPLSDGVLLIERARDLMISVVLSAREKKRHFSGVRPQEVNEYIEKLRLGQTQVGSYVVNVLVPIGVEEKPQGQLEHTSFARIVTRNLQNSLRALSVAMLGFRSNGDPRIFERVVQHGVSSNMCEALLGLSGSARNRDFYISVSPAASERDPRDGTTIFEFTSESVEAIKSAVEYFGDNYVVENTKIEGLIKRLDRVPGEENGNVTVTAKVRGVEKNVTFELAAADYLEAIHAHEKKLGVQCSGDLHVSTRSAKLLNARDFTVFRAGDLF